MSFARGTPVSLGFEPGEYIGQGPALTGQNKHVGDKQRAFRPAERQSRQFQGPAQTDRLGRKNGRRAKSN